MAKALVIKGANFSVNKIDTVTFEGIHTDSISVAPVTVAASEIGATYQLTATVVPSDSIDPIQWTSSDTDVATVTDGLVTIVGCGTCTITAASGTKSATCTVTVEVELDGYTVERGLLAKPLNATNTVPGWEVGIDPGTGRFPSGSQYDYIKQRAATMATDPAETKLSCDYKLLASDGTLKPVAQRTDWAYRDYGWTIPVILPANCKKIKVYSLNADYGSLALFYKSDVVSNAYSDYICWRMPTGWTFSNLYDLSTAPFEYAQMAEFDIPDGYDSINVDWFIPTATTSSPNFEDMTAEQLAAFRIVCC